MMLQDNTWCSVNQTRMTSIYARTNVYHFLVMRNSVSHLLANLEHPVPDSNCSHSLGLLSKA